MTTLKPCPFCGGEPSIVKHPSVSLWSMAHQCRIVGPLVLFNWIPSRDQMIELWNTRAASSALTAEDKVALIALIDHAAPAVGWQLIAAKLREGG